MGIKTCLHCATEHLLTPEFWYQRRNYLECRRYRKDTAKAYSFVYQEKKNKLQAERRAKNPKKFKEETNKFHRTLKGRFRTLKSMAKRRQIEVVLSLGQYEKVVSGSCFYCRGKLPEAGHGIDRVDSQKGYITENIVPCCKTCNLAKHVQSTEEFKQWIVTVYKNWAGG